MAQRTEWITSFLRQCFVTAGVSINMASQGLVVGFSAVLLPQLRKPDSKIPIDVISGSWIASILGFALVLGNFIVPTIMAKYGRRTANIISIIPMIVGWFCVISANSITMLLIARFLQGFSIGLATSLGPVLIGEYTSPNNRGAFLTTISLGISSGVLVVHTLGSFTTWEITAVVCAVICFIDLLIVIYSPESPTWLSDQERYDDCRKVFRWLRGPDEEEELKNMLEASQAFREANEITSKESFKVKVRRKWDYFTNTVTKKEFYKPIFIMFHIYTMGQWAGANVISTYTHEIYGRLMGTDINIPLVIISVDVQRIISSICAVYIMKKVKRKTMLAATVGTNICILLSIACYTYAKTHYTLPFDHPLIGVALIHMQMFTIATGTVPLPFIIAGEVFPLEYRSLAGGISVLFLSTSLFLTIKTAPLLFSSIGLYGTYCVYACIVGYGLTVALVLLPETKDRTLQDIEDEFRGRPRSPAELKSAMSMTSWKFQQNMDRRCSNPFI